MQDQEGSGTTGLPGMLKSILGGQIARVRGKREGIIIAFVIVGILSTLLLFFAPQSLFTYLIMPIAAFALPYYMGNKRLKNILIAGLLFLVVVSLLFDASFSVALYSNSTVTQANSVNAPGFYFRSGDVRPSVGNSSTVFSFHAGFYHPSNASGAPQLVVVLFSTSTSVRLNSSMVAVSSTNAGSGETLTNYSFNTTLPANQVFVYHFGANISGSWISTSASVASTSSQTQTFLSLMGYNLGLSTIVIFVFVGVFYYGIVLVFVLLRKNNRRRDEILSGRARSPGVMPKSKPKDSGRSTKTVKKEKWVCSSCGSEVDASSEKCSSCGEKFD